MGQPIESLKFEKGDKEFVYYVTVPKTHAEMGAYLVTATPGQGVCMVKDGGVLHGDDAFGFKIRDIAADIRKQIDATYGSSKLTDFLRSGSVWHEPSEWAMAIHKDERAYQAVWSKNTGLRSSNNVVEILETVNAVNRDTTFLMLQFRFSNYKACKAEIDGHAAKAF